MKQIAALIFALVCLFSGCAGTPPLKEYTFARTALLSAKNHDAPRLAPAYWHEAEESYRHGELAFKDREYADARAAFDSARRSAEKAENTARVIKFKTGEAP